MELKEKVRADQGPEHPEQHKSGKVSDEAATKSASHKAKVKENDE